MLKNFIYILILIVTILFIALFPEDAEAIPAFARKYKVSCTTCHAPIPKLKPYGAEFAGNGFVIPEEEKERDYITAGDSLLWLNRNFPIAVRFDAYGVYDDKAPVENDLQLPWGVKLLSGGNLYKNIGYYFYFYLSERGEVAGIEDAYIHFNNIFNTNLDVMVGQFQTSDPLLKRELRLTFEDYTFYTKRVGFSKINLTYDRGIMMPYTIDKTGTDLVFLVVNGAGIGDAGEDRKFDDDKFKNYGFRINQAVGEFASIGAFIYYGRERVTDTLGVNDNEVTYIGPDVNLTVGKFELTGQYLLRKDTNPLFIPSAESKNTSAIIAEIIFAPKKERSRYYFTFLYNWVDSDLKEEDFAPLAPYFEFNSLQYHTATLNWTYELARNLRFLVELTRDIELEANRGVLGIVSAF
ncbi:MAG: hypothetical protein JSW33_13495 [bacterium]|nr:MAG: hypothetical protein JSW33_13495 [bacterium]